MISVRRARPSDAPQIGAVHVAAWRSAYPGILPDHYLAGMSVPRMAANYEMMIRAGEGVFVAAETGPPPPGTTPNGLPLPPGAPQTQRIVGFATASRTHAGALAEGEIGLLYVLDDWRERGLGRRLIRAAASHLAAGGCRSAFLWVLRDNPSRWFYQHIGGRKVAEGPIRFAGRELVQTAFLWDPIERLMAASPAS
jgi:ribosomal protein S18 acetylase RimI-like enzyme